MGREASVNPRHEEQQAHQEKQSIPQERQSWVLGDDSRLLARSCDRTELDAKLVRMFNKMHRLKALKDVEPCRIANGLYIGSIGAAQNLESLRAAGITHILNAAPICPCFFKGKFSYMVLQVYDDPDEDLARHFQNSNSFIQEGIRKGGVLVHCYAGVSRSAALSLAYLIANMQLEFTKAFKLLRRARPTAQPNSGFITQLEQLDKRRQESKAQSSKPILCGVLPEDRVGPEL